LKVGILTYHFSDNYGALFQAYALRQWFIQNGHDAVFVNYHPDYVEGGGEFNWRKPISKTNLKILFLKVMGWKERTLGNRAQKHGFEYFRRVELGVQEERYNDAKDLNEAKLNYDLLVCGSDQIWKPSDHYGVDPVYFLNFNTENKTKRISYAPSFGKDFLDEKYKEDVAKLIKKIDAVSVREESGRKVISDITGIEAACVPDPTFLIDDYTQIIKPYPLKSDKHVFCYALRSRESIGEVAEEISARLGCELVSPHNPHRRWREIGNTVFPCPSQWLYLLKSAEFVVTNSFHGAALSIILNKPFVIVGLQGKKEEFNARVKNLLNLVELDCRFVQHVDEHTVDDVLNSSIDWHAVNQRIAHLRNAGQSYLLDNIKI
jgi:hypothetical protein